MDIDAHNPNLMLTSDHKYEDPFERPSWRGMFVYLNAILNLYGLTPRANLYFYKSRLSLKKSKPGPHLGNPHKK
jgi:hypothetical protein